MFQIIRPKKNKNYKNRWSAIQKVPSKHQVGVNKKIIENKIKVYDDSRLRVDLAFQLNKETSHAHFYRLSDSNSLANTRRLGVKSCQQLCN